MKIKIFGKFGSSVLALCLVMTMLVTTVAFAQDNSSLVQSVAENGEVMNINVDEAIDRIVATNEIEAKEIKLPDEGQQLQIDEQLSIDVDLSAELTGVMPSSRSFNGAEATRAIGNNSPNTALGIPSAYFGAEISMPATNNEDWYFYDVAGNAKTSVLFSQQPSGQYVIELYKLDSSGTILNRVEYSYYSGTLQQISYLAEAGRYYLRIIPYTAPTTSYHYQFQVFVSYNSDSYELNEDSNTAHPFTNSMNIAAKIDTPNDVDWYKLTIASQKDLDITAAFAQKNEYAVFLYDSSQNAKASFYVDGGTRGIVLDAGTYYISVLSITKYYSDTANYTLKVAEYVPPAPQPVDSTTIPFQRYESPNFYEIPKQLRFEPGGKIVFDTNCTSPTGSADDRMGVIMEVRFENFHAWEPLTDFYIEQGSNQYIYEFPYKMDHIIGSPLWPGGHVRITLVPDAWVDLSGTIKSMPH